jgi:hypothetical protein
MNLPIEVIEAVNKGKCLLFVGPAFSLEAAEEKGRTYPDGKSLAKSLGWTKPKRMVGARKTIVVPSPAKGAADVEQRLGRAALVSQVKGLLQFSDVPGIQAHRTAISRFPVIFTTNYDQLLESTARAMGGEPTVCHRGDAVPEADPAKRVIYKLWGGFEKPESLVLTEADHVRVELDAQVRRKMRTLIRQNVVFFVGYRPDEEHFERLWTDLTECYGGELPRCHMAVAQGKIDDYLWQKWVWRGLLMFTADPTECMEELEKRID